VGIHLKQKMKKILGQAIFILEIATIWKTNI
jgi:hypothetical protein